MKLKKLIALGLCGFSQIIFAMPLSITPSSPLPSTLPVFGTTTAYYLVTNTTDSPLNNLSVTALPLNVSQVSCQANYCGKTFNLGASGSANASCVLKLTIKGPVDAEDNDPQHHLSICENNINCSETAYPLNVKLANSVPFIAIGAGNYSDNTGGFYPLLVKTNDRGATWSYPRTILDNLQKEIDPEFHNGLLFAAGCSGSANKNVCAAPGFFCKDMGCAKELPLMAIGRDDTQTWSYPASIFQDLQARIDPDFQHGFLNNASCTGSGNNAFCIASGLYFNSTQSFPLIAQSVNGGLNWQYPPSVFKNLKTAIDPTFESGYLLSTGCNLSTCDSVCVASGIFCPSQFCETQLPLIALSTDKGNTWSYPSSIFKNLKTDVDANFASGELKSVSCTGTGKKTICAAAGSYYNNVFTSPLVALTTDGGNTWTYPPSLFTDLQKRIGHGLIGAFFNAASCTGSGQTARCIAAGGYSSRSGVSVPFLALTQDSGKTWDYPKFIYLKLKTVVDSNLRAGIFEGTTCIDKGKKSICMAAGHYCNDKFCNRMFPLVAATTDGGKTWSYPPSIFKNLSKQIDPDFLRGFFNSISCSGTGDYSFCVASGQYSTINSAYPLMAYSTDNGATWIYPPSVFQNLTTSINPNFVIGTLNKSATSGGKLTKLLVPFKRGEFSNQQLR